MKLIVNVLFVLATTYFQTTVATVCVPGSTFKVDCNNCTCGDNGRRYICTDKLCPIIDYKDKYLVEHNQDGYVILKPKPNNEQYVFDDDNKFVLTNRKIRKIKDPLPYPYPYVRDEISYNQDSQDNNYEGVGNYVDDERDYNDEQSYVDADLEEANQDDVFDNNLNN